MKKTLKRFGLVFVLIMALFALATCGAANNGDNGNGSSDGGDGSGAGDVVALDGVQYELADGWAFDAENAVFSNGGIRVTIEKDFEACGSAQARYDEKYEYEDEGIDYSMISVNGDDAVYTEEAVNEIMYCNLFFYKDGEEHNLVVESDFDSYEEDKEKILGFFEGISW